MAFEGRMSETIQQYPLTAFFFFPITPYANERSLLVPVTIKLTHWWVVSAQLWYLWVSGQFLLVNMVLYMVLMMFYCMICRWGTRGLWWVYGILYNFTVDTLCVSIVVVSHASAAKWPLKDECPRASNSIHTLLSSFSPSPLCWQKITSGTCYYKAYPLMSGFSPVVIPMGKWAIFTCKYGSVNGFNDVLLYDMPMGNEGFVVSGWYSI